MDRWESQDSTGGITKHKAHWHATESHSVACRCAHTKKSDSSVIHETDRQIVRDQFPMKLISQMREKGDWYAVASQTVLESMTFLFQINRFFLW